MLFAGLDVSTQSCKLVVIESESSQIVFNTAVNYDNDLPQYNTKNGVIQGLEKGVSESDPLMWLKAVDMVLLRLKESDVKQKQIKSISVSGQQHGLVALDHAGKLSRSGSKLWNDFSTQNECDFLTEAVGGPNQMIAEIGNSQRTGYSAAKILHFKRNEPENYKKTSTFLLVHNYINWYLSGGIEAMEAGDVSGMALWHPGRQQWSDKVLNAIDVDLKSKLPPVKSSTQSIGHIAGHLAERFNLDTHCTIGAGSGDNMYGAIGTGNIEAGIITISLGTSGTAYTVLEKPFIDEKGEIAAFCDSTSKHLPLLCVSNLANGYNQILEQYGMSHQEFNKIIQKTEAGNGGRILIPWFEGERTPDVPLATPIYFGFRLNDFSKEILSRAVLEGAVLNLYDGFKRLPVKAREIRLTGGLSQSSVWRQVIADIFETEVVPVEGEGAALGAALHAQWVWQKENGETMSLSEIINPFIKLNEAQRVKPITQNIEVYRKQKELFSALSIALRTNPKANSFIIRNQLQSLLSI